MTLLAIAALSAALVAAIRELLLARRCLREQSEEIAGLLDDNLELEYQLQRERRASRGGRQIIIDDPVLPDHVPSSRAAGSVQIEPGVTERVLGPTPFGGRVTRRDEWPPEQRVDIIGHNGPTGAHYE